MGGKLFWSIATLMVVATTAVLVVPLFWRDGLALGVAGAGDVRPRMSARRRAALAVAVIFPLVALSAYFVSGRPDLNTVAPPPVADIATLHARAALAGKGENGGDLGVAIEKLQARLAANPRDVDGWRLLAQSYEFQGRASEAAEARKHAEQAGAGGVPAPTAPPAMMDAAAEQLAQSAEEHRRKREFPQAIASFAALAKRGAMSADLWADYADAIGGARGRLDDEAAACIAKALALDPDHTKALWLLGSIQSDRHDYRAALDTWQRLTRLLPPDSPDARIIAANLEEARGNLAAGPASAAPASAVAPAAVSGLIRLDPRWRDRIAPGSVLFILARAADERGPPLAVVRTTPGPWPMTFTLDDRNAMMPGRSLSNFSRVILEARISRSGNALAQPGDLRAVSAVLDPRAAGKLELTISEQVIDGNPGTMAPQGG